jgi:hypothetical protein
MADLWRVPDDIHGLCTEQITAEAARTRAASAKAIRRANEAREKLAAAVQRSREPSGEEDSDEQSS